MKRLFLTLLTAAFILPAVAEEPLQTPDYGKIDRHYIYSPELNETITVDVWMPEEYLNEGKGFPVIYMHDGQNLFDASTTWNHQSWEMDSVCENLIKTKRITPPIIVGIHSKAETRIGDLMPQKALGEIPSLELPVTLGDHEIDLRGDAYARFVATTLKQKMDSLYNLSGKPEDTTVMGSSMGGLISIYILCEYPDIFGNAGCLSTHWPGNPDGGWPLEKAMASYIGKTLPVSGNHRLYFDHGTQDIDAYYAPGEEMAMQVIRDKGYRDGVDLVEFVDEGAGHQEKYWAKRVYRPLELFLGTGK